MNQSNQIGAKSVHDTNSLLAFRVNTYFFCTHACTVVSIIKPPKISRIPLSPHSLAGLAFFQGNPIPVFCLRTYLGEPLNTEQQDGVVIVAKTDNGTIGVWVDEARQMVNVEKNNFINPDPVLAGAFVKYFIPTKEEMLLYIDLDLLISNIKARKKFVSVWQQYNTKHNMQVIDNKSAPISFTNHRPGDNNIVTGSHGAPDTVPDSEKSASERLHHSWPQKPPTKTTGDWQLKSNKPKSPATLQNSETIRTPGDSNSGVTLINVQPPNSQPLRIKNTRNSKVITGNQRYTTNKQDQNQPNVNLTKASHKALNSDYAKSQIYNTSASLTTRSPEKPKITGDAFNVTVTRNNVENANDGCREAYNISSNNKNNRKYSSSTLDRGRTPDFSDQHTSRGVVTKGRNDLHAGTSSFEAQSNGYQTARNTTTLISPANVIRPPVFNKDGNLATTRIEQKTFASGWLVVGTLAALLALLLWWPFNDKHGNWQNTTSIQETGELPGIATTINTPNSRKNYAYNSDGTGPAQKAETNPRDDNDSINDPLDPITGSGVESTTNSITKPSMNSIETPTVPSIVTEIAEKPAGTPEPKTALTNGVTTPRSAKLSGAEKTGEPEAFKKDAKNENGIVLELETETYSIVIERPKTGKQRDKSSNFGARKSGTTSVFANKSESLDTNTTQPNSGNISRTTSDNSANSSRQETGDYQKNNRSSLLTQRPGQTQLNTPKTPDNNPARKFETFTYIVVKGDTLWDIAAKFLGDPFKYKLLSKLSHVRDPDWIYPGDIVTIRKIIR